MSKVIIGTVIPDPRYPALTVNIEINEQGGISIRYGTSHVVAMSPQCSTEVADLLYSAADKAGAVAQAHEDAKRMAALVEQAKADRLAAITGPNF